MASKDRQEEDACRQPSQANVAGTACKHSNMEEIVPETFLRIWVGYLKEEHSDMVQTHLEEYNVSCVFESSDDMLLPAAQGLVSAAQEHFAFFSAGEGEVIPVEEKEADEGEEDPEEDLESGAPHLGARVDQLEKTMDKVQAGIEQLLAASQQDTSQPDRFVKSTPKRKPALKKSPTPAPAKVTFASSSGASAKNKESVKYPSLDPTVVQAALRAGVEESSLMEMEALIGSNPKGLKVKDVNPVMVMDPLSEEEDEGDGTPGDASGANLDQGGSGDAVAAALVKLTSLVDLLAEDKKKRTKVTKLEAALDSVSCATSDTSALGLGKKTAAARRALRQTFRDHPEEIHQLLERLMSEDLLSTTVGPNMATPTLNARAWVEFRSRIGNFKTSAHAAWAAAAIADALRGGDHDRARAIALLLLLQLDQTAIDKGNWSFSGELSLEPLPPFSSM